MSQYVLGKGPGLADQAHPQAYEQLISQAQKLGNDNFALLFQAHLEITQLFSNAHDILYSPTRHREPLYMGGEHGRYIVRDALWSIPRRT